MCVAFRVYLEHFSLGLCDMKDSICFLLDINRPTVTENASASRSHPRIENHICSLTLGENDILQGCKFPW